MKMTWKLGETLDCFLLLYDMMCNWETLKIIFNNLRMSDWSQTLSLINTTLWSNKKRWSSQERGDRKAKVVDWKLTPSTYALWATFKKFTFLLFPVSTTGWCNSNQVPFTLYRSQESAMGGGNLINLSIYLNNRTFNVSRSNVLPWIWRIKQDLLLPPVTMEFPLNSLENMLDPTVFFTR